MSAANSSGVTNIEAEAALRALAHPGRRQMLQLVWDTERSSSELAERCGLSKPAASQHLGVLRDAKLVSVRVEGNRRLYQARATQLAEVRSFLDRFWAMSLDRLQTSVERGRGRSRNPGTPGKRGEATP